MTLLAGRVPSLHGLDRSTFREEANMPGILKSGVTQRQNKDVNCCIDKQTENSHRQEDSKRLVRFCEEENVKLDKRKETMQNDDQEVIMFGSNMYFINNPDPNSAVRKLFPNSKLTPISPVFNKTTKPPATIKPTPLTIKALESNRNTINRTQLKSDHENNASGLMVARKKFDSNTLRRNIAKVPKETKTKSEKSGEASTPLIERIKRLAICDSENESIGSAEKQTQHCNNTKVEQNGKNAGLFLSNKNKVKLTNLYQLITEDKPNTLKDGNHLTIYNEDKNQPRVKQVTDKKTVSLTEEARRSFMTSLSQQNENKPCDRSSVATISSTAETEYSLSDIEEVLTEEEKEIRDAFAEEIKQDELELFVQQDAGRTERLRKRYNTTPKPENPMPMPFSNNTYPQVTTGKQQYSPNSNLKKDKPKFGSTIEILQQLQQQMESPYQLEGRRTACSNYSDISIPISDRLFCDESSDSYEPVLGKPIVYRTSSLDSKNYEEIDNFPSAFSVPRTKSQEHPRLTHFEADPYFYPSPPIRNTSNFAEHHQLRQQNVYTSSPNLYGHYNNPLPDKFSSYNNLSTNGKQLHPVLQRQYCRYTVSELPKKNVQDKILTPPIRMHTYMNVPTNAACYFPPPTYNKISPPPPYSRVNPYSNTSSNYDEQHYSHNNIYQNVPVQINPHLMTLRRLCTEKERGVPEGASSSQDSKESCTSLISPPEEYYLRPHSNVSSVSKSGANLSHKYCVNV